MQTNLREIYEELDSAETGGLYKALGNFIFRETYELMKEPPSLIIKLKNVGNWYLRRQRMQIKSAIMEIQDLKLEDKKREDFKFEYQYKGFLKDVSKRTLFKDRLKEYEAYVTERDEIRAIRYKTQTLLNGGETSDDIMEEY